MPFYDPAMLHMAVEAAFEDLLATWRAHDSRRRRPGVSVADLALTRTALDQARRRMHRLRTAIHPESAEFESVVQSIWCETLDCVVHVRWTDRHPTRPGNFACPCGHLVPIDRHALRAAGGTDMAHERG